MPIYDRHASDEKREAFEVAEAAREAEWALPSFVAELFQGRLQWGYLHPYPEQSAEDKRIGDAFIAELEAFLKEKLNPDEVDRTGTIPEEVYDGLARMGCFALKIPKRYGGMGFSQVNYNRTIALVASYCGSTAVMLSAHQSIGVPQPLLLFGTPEQCERYLPRFRKRYISAFALTEVEVGSDPARMTTFAQPVDNGESYVLNGQKLWCTNGPIADIFVVMARTPSIVIDGREKKQITAFIVEKDMPGVEVIHRCRFMGLNGIQNGLIRLKDVRVPKENILWKPGAGLKLALTTLNTGRLTVPAATTSMAKLCIAITRRWCNERVQWGSAIGKHEAIASKVGRMAAMTFAMESIAWFVSSMADQKKMDMRLEAAMSKLFCTESAWRIADDTVQIRGGRGYETASSLAARGEKGIPVERIMRDARINLIIEGTSEIMYLFIARESLDPHLRLARDFFDPHASLLRKTKTFIRLVFHYALWYPRLWILPGRLDFRGVPPRLRCHLRYAAKNSRRLARNVFHAMLIFGPGLERKQRVLARLVNIGTDLFAMACSIARSAMLQKRKSGEENSEDLADLFCVLARERIGREFGSLFFNHDVQLHKAARNLLDGKYEWIEKGICGNL